MYALQFLQQCYLIFMFFIFLNFCSEAAASKKRRIQSFSAREMSEKTFKRSIILFTIPASVSSVKQYVKKENFWVVVHIIHANNTTTTTLHDIEIKKFLGRRTKKVVSKGGKTILSVGRSVDRDIKNSPKIDLSIFHKRFRSSSFRSIPCFYLNSPSSSSCNSAWFRLVMIRQRFIGFSYCGSFSRDDIFRNTPPNIIIGLLHQEPDKILTYRFENKVLKISLLSFRSTN